VHSKKNWKKKKGKKGVTDVGKGRKRAKANEQTNKQPRRQTTTDHHTSNRFHQVSLKNVKGFRNAPIPLNSLLLVYFFYFFSLSLLSLSRVLGVLVRM